MVTQEAARDEFDRRALLDAIENLVVSEQERDPSIEQVQRDPVLLDVCRNGHRFVVAASPATGIAEGQIRLKEQVPGRHRSVRFRVTRADDDPTAFQYGDEEGRSLDGVAIRIVRDFLAMTS
ncbi:MAG TPA: hypothetical protein VH497_07675 [Vicinamibacterales bacterium]|jgi:hypothetical protein